MGFLSLYLFLYVHMVAHVFIYIYTFNLLGKLKQAIVAGIWEV